MRRENGDWPYRRMRLGVSAYYRFRRFAHANETKQDADITRCSSPRTVFRSTSSWPTTVSKALGTINENASALGTQQRGSFRLEQLMFLVGAKTLLFRF